MIIPMELPSLDVCSRPRTLRMPLPACLTDCLSPLVCAVLEARGGSGRPPRHLFLHPCARVWREDKPVHDAVCALKQLPVPQQLACTEFSNCSSFGSDGAFVPDAVALARAHPPISARFVRRHGPPLTHPPPLARTRTLTRTRASAGTEFTGDNGFTVTDPNHPDSSWSSPSQLACSEFTGCSSFGGDGALTCSHVVYARAERERACAGDRERGRRRVRAHTHTRA